MSSVGPILELSTTQTLGSHLGKSWRRGEEWGWQPQPHTRSTTVPNHTPFIRLFNSKPKRRSQ